MPPLVTARGVFSIEELEQVLTPYAEDPDAEAEAEGELHFWHERLLPHAYVIATSYAGDPVVQVASGRYAGRVLMTNHESWHGGFQFLSGHVGSDDEDDAEEFVESAGRGARRGVGGR